MASLIQWLSKLAENRVRAAVQMHRAGLRDVAREVRPEAYSQEGSSDLVHEPQHSATPSVQLAAAEEEERLIECLGSLKEEYREVILLRDYSGASWDDVAKALERPSANAARMLHARAIAELAARFAD